MVKFFDKFSTTIREIKKTEEKKINQSKAVQSLSIVIIKVECLLDRKGL